MGKAPKGKGSSERKSLGGSLTKATSKPSKFCEDADKIAREK